MRAIVGKQVIYGTVQHPLVEVIEGCPHAFPVLHIAEIPVIFPDLILQICMPLFCSPNIPDHPCDLVERLQGQTRRILYGLRRKFQEFCRISLLDNRICIGYKLKGIIIAHLIDLPALLRSNLGEKLRRLRA